MKVIAIGINNLPVITAVSPTQLPFIKSIHSKTKPYQQFHIKQQILLSQ